MQSETATRALLQLRKGSDSRIGAERIRLLEVIGDLGSISAAAKALGLSDYGIVVGRPANLVLVRAENIGMAIAERQQDRLVIARGKVVAENGMFVGELGS